MHQDVSNPHDAFFKAVFGDPEKSRQLFEALLPRKMTEELDLTRLRVENGSFVDEHLRLSHSDLLFHTSMRSGEQAMVYLLFEHQSTSDGDMPFRLLRYIVRIWEQHRAQYPEEHPLPRIVPIVLYQGKRAWTAPLRLSEALEGRTDLGIRPPELEYALLDLGRIPDSVLREGLELGLWLAMDLFRHIRDPDFPEYFRRFLPLLGELGRCGTGLEYIETILRYVYHVRSVDEWRDVVDIIRESEPIIRETAMTTIAEYLIEKGKTAGIEEGLKRGLSQGLEQGLEQGLSQGLEKGLSQGLEKGLSQGLQRGQTEGKLQEARGVLIELLEEQFGTITPSLAAKLVQTQSYDVLVSLRRRRKHCRSIEEFESLVELALQ
jgi:predicted transposase/invertase (TIGR01784 family)